MTQTEEIALASAKQAEYDRWFQRGKEADRKSFLSVLASMRPGSNAYEAFADGYDSQKRSKHPVN